MRFNFLLLSVLLILTHHSYAAPCTVIAEVKLPTTQDISKVSVSRGMKQYSLSDTTRHLCEGDMLTIPNTFKRPVKIVYYSDDMQQQSLAAGEQHEIMGLKKPCNKWCRVTKKTKRLYILLTRKNIKPPKRIVDTTHGENDEIPTTTLAKGETKPLYLFTQTSDIPFFWKGGKRPYSLTIKNEQGQTVVEQKRITRKHTQFSLPDIEHTYQLILQDKYKNAIEQTLIVRLPPFPLEPNKNKLRNLTRLLQDTKRNWRLEVWRQLHQLPDSDAVNKFKAHLVVNDF